MRSLVAAHGLTPTEHALTPELALVDPALAREARAGLPQPDDTLERIEALVQMSRRASLAQQSLETAERPVSDLVESARRVAWTRRRRSALLAGAAAAGTLVIALLVGVRVDVRGTPAGADTTAVDETPTPSVPTTPSTGVEAPAKPVPQHKPGGAGRPPRKTKPALAPQRFAWAPTPGASAYHVELFRGSSKVFEADTARPALTLPAHWVFEQRRRSLEPGSYRWYVWPVVSGTRAARAIVQSNLVIPTR